jgi:hypothetical protein
MDNIIIFKTISMFVKELGNMYGKSFRNVNLYMHLIDRTTFSHELAIQKHIDAFRVFCEENTESLMNSDHLSFKKKTVKYSKKVFINFQSIFEKTISDGAFDTSKTIWKYLHIIAMNLLPSFKSQFRDKIIANKKSPTATPSQDNSGAGVSQPVGQTCQEENFLEELITKIESNVNLSENTNPMEAVTGIMQSGIFTEMISGMNNGFKNGTLNMNNMPNAIQKILSKMSPQSGKKGNKEFDQMKSTMDSMLGLLSFSGGGSDSSRPVPDMQNLMSLLMPQVANMMAGDQDSDDEKPPLPPPRSRNYLER